LARGDSVRDRQLTEIRRSQRPGWPSGIDGDDPLAVLGPERDRRRSTHPFRSGFQNRVSDSLELFVDPLVVGELGIRILARNACYLIDRQRDDERSQKEDRTDLDGLCALVVAEMHSSVGPAFGYKPTPQTVP
jgi:hypothetical protein